MTPLARDLAARGIAAWNIEYRRVGQEGGGWPGTLEDAAAAADAVAGLERDRREPRRHRRALGRRAARALARRRGTGSPPGAPGAEPRVRRAAPSRRPASPTSSPAPRTGLGGGACQALLGGEPDDVPERYAVASPAALLPLGVPQLLVHGARDDARPARPEPRLRSRRRERRATRSISSSFARADHFDVIEADRSGLDGRRRLAARASLS